MKYRLILENGDWHYEDGAKYVKDYIKEFGNVIKVKKIYSDGRAVDVTNKYL